MATEAEQVVQAERLGAAVHHVALAVGVACFSPFLHAADQDTVVVTATGFEQKIQNAPASISVISKQQIEDKAYRDVTAFLEEHLLAVGE